MGSSREVAVDDERVLRRPHLVHDEVAAHGDGHGPRARQRPDLHLLHVVLPARRGRRGSEGAGVREQRHAPVLLQAGQPSQQRSGSQPSRSRPPRPPKARLSGWLGSATEPPLPSRGMPLRPAARTVRSRSCTSALEAAVSRRGVEGAVGEGRGWRAADRTQRCPEAAPACSRPTQKAHAPEDSAG